MNRIAGSQHPVAYNKIIEDYIKKGDEQVAKGKNIKKKKSRDGCVQFKKVQQQESELQSSNPLPLTNSYYKPTIPTSLPLYLILACHGSEVGIVSS